MLAGRMWLDPKKLVWRFRWYANIRTHFIINHGSLIRWLIFVRAPGNETGNLICSIHLFISTASLKWENRFVSSKQTIKHAQSILINHLIKQSCFLPSYHGTYIRW